MIKSEKNVPLSCAFEGQEGAQTLIICDFCLILITGDYRQLCDYLFGYRLHTGDKPYKMFIHLRNSCLTNVYVGNLEKQ